MTSIAMTASADPDGKFGVGGDLMLVVPVGDMADASGVLLGPVARFGYRVLPALELTGRTGYLFGFDKAQAPGIKASYGVLPLWAGARYFVLDPDAGPYVAGEVGINLIRGSVSVDDAASSAASAAAGGATLVFPTRTDARLGFDVGAGWVLSKELPVEVRAQLNCFNLLGQSSGESVLFGIGISAGYTYRF